ncbi:ensconsin isoform X2 [Stigmatopora nigra]
MSVTQIAVAFSRLASLYFAPSTCLLALWETATLSMTTCGWPSGPGMAPRLKMPATKGRRARRPGRGGAGFPAPALFTIFEEGQKGNAVVIGRKAKASFYKSDDDRAFSPAAPGSSLCSPTLTSTATPTSGGRSPNNDHTAAPPKSDSSLFNKTDERLRLARERREEYDKQNAAKEAEWQAREERARRHYQNHLEERRRKLEEQRLKEERRRSAVEEKRRRKMADDQVRHEAVMRRSMERAPVARAKANRWSWGGPLPINSPASPATDGDRRSASTVNLSKQHEPVITKRLSSSSATLLHSPDRGRRRLPLTPWESNVVQRLQQPTHSYLARSRSAASLSGDQRASFQSPPGRPLSHSRSHDRSLGGETSASARRRTVGTAQTAQKNRDSVRKSWSNLSLPLGPALTLPLKIRSSSPLKREAKMMVPSPGRPPQKTEARPPTPRTPKGLGAEDPGNLRPDKSREAGDEGVPAPDGVAGGQSAWARAGVWGRFLTAGWTWLPDAAGPKPCAGTTDAEEAGRILAEKRRLVRRQREREEEERHRQEQKARLAQEEMARRKAEERVRREEEARLKEEEDRLKEEEAHKRAEEERLQREREEAQEAQKALKQREEEESRQKEETERLKQEREKHFQKEEAERLERKKRLEEIMKRTRRSDAADKKTSPDKMAEPPEGDPGPNSNGCPAPPDPNSPPGGPPAPRENGQLEDKAVLHSPPEENGLPEADVA